MAMAQMMPMIATTTSSSSRVNPFFRIGSRKPDALQGKGSTTRLPISKQLQLLYLMNRLGLIESAIGHFRAPKLTRSVNSCHGLRHRQLHLGLLLRQRSVRFEARPAARFIRRVANFDLSVTARNALRVV